MILIDLGYLQNDTVIIEDLPDTECLHHIKYYNKKESNNWIYLGNNLSSKYKSEYKTTQTVIYPSYNNERSYLYDPAVYLGVTGGIQFVKSALNIKKGYYSYASMDIKLCFYTRKERQFIRGNTKYDLTLFVRYL